MSKFDSCDWTVNCRWKNGPPPVNDRRCNYKTPGGDLDGFDTEGLEWIKEDILIPWDYQRDGEIKNLLPMMCLW